MAPFSPEAFLCFLHYGAATGRSWVTVTLVLCCCCREPDLAETPRQQLNGAVNTVQQCKQDEKFPDIRNNRETRTRFPAPTCGVGDFWQPLPR